MSSWTRGSVLNRGLQGGAAIPSWRWAAPWGAALCGTDSLPSWCQARGLAFWAWANLAVALAYAVLGWAVGHFFARFGLFPAPIWLPAGLAGAAALLGGARLSVGTFLGSLIVNGLVFEAALPAAACISVGNTLGPLAGVLLTRRLRPAGGLFTRLQGVLAFILGAVLLHAATTATIGTLSLLWLGRLPWAEAAGHWSNWLLCDAGGTFYFAPSLALWLGVEPEQVLPSAARRALPHRPLLDGAVWLSTAGLAMLIFSVEPPAWLPSAQLVFLLAVPLSWIALRISLRAAYTLLTLVCLISSVGTVAGLGPFQGAGVANPMQSASVLVVLCAMNILTLVALVQERREAEWALSLSDGTLEVRVAERTALLRQQAETDALTGIANRRGFLDRAERSLAARGPAPPFGLITFDLDHFKAINDSAGHAGGDAVLQMVARSCQSQLRAGDLFGRLGGEEFVIALPGHGRADACAVAERLRKALHTVRPGFPLPGGRLAASFGVAIREPEEGLGALLMRADAALYEAKHRGRDQVRLAA